MRYDPQRARQVEQKQKKKPIGHEYYEDLSELVKKRPSRPVRTRRIEGWSRWPQGASSHNDRPAGIARSGGLAPIPRGEEGKAKAGIDYSTYRCSARKKM